MNTKKLISFSVGGLLLAGCLAGYSAAAASRSGDISPGGGEFPEYSVFSGPSLSAAAEYGGPDRTVSCEERFRPYEPFGLIYDSGRKALLYQGKPVRWFEDSYAVEEGLWADNDFFDENGEIDVYAVRDFTGIVRAEDGSYDPAGKLIGVQAFTAEEFAARDIEAIRNPPPAVALAGDPPAAGALEEMAKEYEAFGVSYDAKNDQWYFQGEKVRFFLDVLTSNGESLSGGNFKGAIRTSGSAAGTVDIYTIRDFARPNADGNGTLTDIEKYSQAEFDERTRKEQQSGSGFCTFVEE